MYHDRHRPVAAAREVVEGVGILFPAGRRDGPGRGPDHLAALDRRQREACARLMLERLETRFSDAAVRRNSGACRRLPASLRSLHAEQVARLPRTRLARSGRADLRPGRQRFGGSVATHPLVVEQLAEMAGIPVRYLGWESAGELVAAIPTWGRHLACPRTLKRRGKKGLYDLGNAELILPVADDARIASAMRTLPVGAA